MKMLYYGSVMVSVAPARRPPASPHQAAARRLNLQPQQGQQPSCCAVLSCVDLRACMIITRLPASLSHRSTTPAAPAPQLVWAYSLVSARTSLQHRLCCSSKEG